MGGSARGGNDILTGGSLSGVGTIENNIFGDAAGGDDGSGGLTGDAKGGADNLTGGSVFGDGSVTNTLYGDAYRISGTAHAGKDVLTGGSNSGSRAKAEIF